MRLGTLGNKRLPGMIAALWGFGALATWGASGCNQCTKLNGTNPDECYVYETRCADASHIEKCQADQCQAVWSGPQRCADSQPYCVTTASAQFAVLVPAECAASPHCADTQACAQRGLCEDSADGAGCVLNAAGCAKSCGDTGSCGFDGTACVATEAGCAASSACTTEGVCGFSNGYCSLTPEGCAKSTNFCLQNGQCGFANGLCAPTEAGCAASTECVTNGVCAVGDQSCVASQAGCAASTNCALYGDCMLRDQTCSKP